jgi:predicted lipoprotein with Yx(FWY)xxD motif
LRSRVLLLVPLAFIAELALIAAAIAILSSNSGKSTTAATSSTPATRSSAAASSSGSVALSTRTIPHLGTVLVNGQGRTLYVFMPDAASKVTCVGACAVTWPPLKISSGQKAATSGAINASLVGSDSDPSGGRVVTYQNWPLYLYVADPTAGTYNGQGLNSKGGVWFVVAPSGALVTQHEHALQRRGLL